MYTYFMLVLILVDVDIYRTLFLASKRFKSTPPTPSFPILPVSISKSPSGRFPLYLLEKPVNSERIAGKIHL